jgi:hypothetical protein
MAFPIEWFLHTACSVACLSSCHTKALWSQLIPMTRSTTAMVLHNPLSSAFYQGNDSMLKLGFKKFKVEWYQRCYLLSSPCFWCGWVLTGQCLCFTVWKNL